MLKFEIGKVYAHANMLDTCVLVTGMVDYATTDYARLKVRWFNTRGVDLGENELIKIKEADVKHWREVKFGPTTDKK